MHNGIPFGGLLILSDTAARNGAPRISTENMSWTINLVSASRGGLAGGLAL
jgi:hypothetical protein